MLKSSAPKGKRAIMCLREKMQVSDKLLPGMSYSAVGGEFNVSESTVYVNKVSLNRNTHKTRLWINRLMKCYDQ